MHRDLLSTRYHLCCNRDHKSHLSIRNRRTEAVIKKDLVLPGYDSRKSVELGRTVGSDRNNHCELL